MARERSPLRDKAKELYLAANGNIKLADIAAELEVTDSQIRKWKSTDKWDSSLNGALPLKSNVTNEKERVTNKRTPKVTVKEAKRVKEDSKILESKLTDKQMLFCIYYAKTFNATKSYQKAYGCDYLTANAHGYKMLSKVVIKEEIQRIKENRLREAMLTKDDILNKYIEIANADITDFVEFGTELKETEQGVKKISTLHFKDASEVDGTLISEISTGREGVKIRVLDRMKALEFLAKHYGLMGNEDKTVQNFNINITGDDE